MHENNNLYIRQFTTREIIGLTRGLTQWHMTQFESDLNIENANLKVVCNNKTIQNN